MIREFDEEELEHPERGRDTELTLSAGMLLALGCGLLVLCGICFALGYVVGHRGETASNSVLPRAETPGILQPNGSTGKPMAGAQTPATPPPTTVAVETPDSPGLAQPQSAGVAPIATGRAGTEEQPQPNSALTAQVKPALASQTTAAQPAQPATSLHVQPALSQVQGWMVQIAAVSHAEDAEVLVNALKKRGYAVTVRRDVADTLLHVQTGPFVSRNDANAMRQKLLSDGYNAIVQP
jgi:cell division septation protein DedD